MNLKSLKSRLNNQKNRQIRVKIIKSSMTFNENKPNFKNIKIGISSFMTNKYEILPAWRSKNQTQFKANSNSIKADFNAKQTQYKPNQTQFILGMAVGKPARKPRFLRHYSLDYFVRWAVEYPCCMFRVSKPIKPCNKEELKCRLITPAQNPVVPSCLIAGTSWQVPAQWRWLRK
jgi:hypothetical protein